jgi:hypothetical protein
LILPKSSSIQTFTRYLFGFMASFVNSNTMNLFKHQNTFFFLFKITMVHFNSAKFTVNLNMYFEEKIY